MHSNQRKRKRETSRVVLIDARNFCYRHAFTHRTLSSKGRPSGMFYGALTGLLRLHRIYPGCAFVMCWDGAGSRTDSWRHKIYPEYKAHRAKNDSELPIGVQKAPKQMGILERTLKIMGVRQFSVDSLEADDLIGVLATHAATKFDEVLIYSTDKDFYQLMTDKIFVVRDLDKSKNGASITEKYVERRFGVKVNEWLNYRALTGDASDHIIKPLSGVGPKTIPKLLANGLLASCKTWDELPKKTRKLYSEKWKSVWDKAHLNFNLCQIITSGKDVRITKREQRDLLAILSKLTSKKKFYRREKGKSEEAYKKMLAILADYEMHDLMGRRNELLHLS